MRVGTPGCAAALATACALLLCLSAVGQTPVSSPTTSPITSPTTSTVLKDGRIGYVMTDLFWSVYQTADAREECPQGFNAGPREQFAELYPDYAARSVLETQLKQESETWHPSSNDEDLAFLEVEGPYAFGLDLDGKDTREDFLHPDGTRGIDNQVYRAVGCIIGFRGPDGVEYIFQNKAILDERYNRMMIAVSDVDSLLNDESVIVELFRGRDKLLTEATGTRAVSRGTQRVDRRWGETLIRTMRGTIREGVLRTEPIHDAVLPWMNLNVPSQHLIRDFRLELALTEDTATGLVAGYADVDTWYRQLIRNDSTHHLSNGQISGISLYKALRRLADAYADPDSGEYTAISTALNVKMVQVFIVDPES